MVLLINFKELLLYQLSVVLTGFTLPHIFQFHFGFAPSLVGA